MMITKLISKPVQYQLCIDNECILALLLNIYI